MTPQDAPNAVERFDAAMIDKIVALGGADLLEQMSALFLDLLDGRVEAVAAAARGEAIEEGVRAAHSLKSTAGQLGLPRFCWICKEIEVAGRSRNLAEIARCLPSLREAADEARSTLATELERRKDDAHE